MESCTSWESDYPLARCGFHASRGQFQSAFTAMNKIRVLLVDDSAVIRRLLTDTLAHDPDIEVIGMAGNGEIALAKIEQLKPDIITLDIEMPVMDGLATLKALYADVLAEGGRTPAFTWAQLVCMTTLTASEALLY